MGMIKIRITRTQVVEFEDGPLEGQTPESLLAENVRNAEEMPEHVFDNAAATISGEIVNGYTTTPAANEEVERLRAIEQLYKADIKAWNPVYEQILNERNELRAELSEARAKAIGECVDAAKRKAEEYRATAERYAEHAKREILAEAKAIDEDSRDQCFAKQTAMIVFAGELESLTGQQAGGGEGVENG